MQYFLLVYFVEIAVLGLSDYCKYGPYSLRNAALFYYPVFSVFSFLLFPAGLGKVLSNRTVRFLFILPLFLLSFYLTSGSRSEIVANVMCFLLAVAFIFRDKILILLAALFVMFIFSVNGDKAAIKSIVSFKEMRRNFIDLDKQVRAVDYRMVELPINFYNKNIPNKKAVGSGSYNAQQSSAIAPNSNDHKKNGRDYENCISNSLFRIFIWRDMIEELVSQRKVLGFGMGYPQRSRSLECLGWASSEWKRDGWITPHNSYLHVIYRLGIAGVLLLILLFIWVVRLFTVFWKANHSGFFALIVFLHFIIRANFLLIFELPYYAIPMWFVFGICIYCWKSIQVKNILT